MFKKMKLGTKLISGFGIVSLLLLIVVAFSWNGLGSVTSGYTDLIENTVPIIDEAHQVEGQILECRRNEKDFLARLDLKYKDKLDANIDGLKEHTTIIKNLGAKNSLPQLVSLAGEIEEAAEDYQSTLHRIVDAWELKGLRPDQGIQGEFRSAAHNLAVTLASFQVDDLTLALSTVRRYEKDYRLTHSDKYRDKWLKSVASFEYRLEVSPCEQAVKEGQRLALSAYQTAQESYIENSDVALREELYGVMRQNAHKMEAGLLTVALPRAQIMLLEIRKQEKDYLLRYNTKDAEGKYSNRDKYFQKTNDAVNKLRRACKKAQSKGFKPEVAAKINGQLDVYSQAFATLVEKDDEIRVLGGHLREAAYRIAPLAEQIIVLAEQTSDAASEETATNAQHSQLLVLIIGGVAIVLGMSLGLILTRSITAPINKVISGMKAGSEQVASASSQVSSASVQLAEGAGKQASSLEETSASLELLSSGARDSAESSRQANDRALEIKSHAEKGQGAMTGLNEAMDKIKASADETAKIIKTIDEIAFQTNLLALNAAVEAARAGDAGKGFAVVAEEVRNLAQRSAEAAKGTAHLIEDSKGNSDLGVKATGDVTVLLEEIVAGIVVVSDSIGQISTAADEQARSVAEVNNAVGQMDSVTQANAAGAEESASAAEEMSAQASEMHSLVQDLVVIISGQSGVANQVVAGATPRATGTRSSELAEEYFKTGIPQGKAFTPDQVIPLDEESLLEL